MDGKNIGEKVKILSFDEFVLVFQHNLVKILLWAIISGCLALATFIFFVPKTYSATAQLYVITTGDTMINLSDLQVGSSLTSDYMQLMTRNDFLRDIIRELKLEEEYTVYSVKKILTIDNPKDTRVLNISVSDSDPRAASDIANAVVNKAISEISEIMETSRLKLTQRALIPTAPVAPNMILYTIAISLVCAFLFFSYVLFSYVADDSIRSADTISNKLNIAVLSVINGEDNDGTVMYGD